MGESAEDELLHQTFHVAHVHDQPWLLRKRYTNPRRLSKGSFGVVCMANDEIRGKPVAIKRLIEPMKTSEHAKRTFRELKLLLHLGGEARNSVLGLLDAFTPQDTYESISDVYIVTELGQVTLRRAMKEPSITTQHLDFYMYRMMVGLKYIHGCHVIHRDLKPENIIVWGDPPSLRILDFGLARVNFPTMHTQYVQSRYYRAPEVILRTEYTDKADVWSAACIIAECYKKRFLFEGKGVRGDDTVQLKAIINTLGLPPRKVLRLSDDEDSWTLKHIESFAPGDGDLSKHVPNASPILLDLLSKMLKYDPEERWSAEQCLTHAYFQPWRHEQSEPVSLPQMFLEPSMEEEQTSLPVNADEANATLHWKRLLWEVLAEIEDVHGLRRQSSKDQ